jgi:succinate dehydrogenase / fumarate reductase cytochrome b subunit
MACPRGLAGRCEDRLPKAVVRFTSTSTRGLAYNEEKRTSMVKPLEYLTYRGGPGHWSWILHRLAGVGVFLFLLIHIVDIALIGWGPKVFNKLLFLYRAPAFRAGEVLLVGAVLYHAINGIRICIIDFWPETMGWHRKLTYAVGIIFVALFIPTAIYMLSFVVK